MHPPQTIRARANKAAILPTAILLAAMAAAILLAIWPRQYLSTATLKIQMGATASLSSLPAVAELLQSETTLDPVIEHFDLQKRWNASNRDQARARLRNALRVEGVKDTDLIRVSIFDRNPGQAAALANAIAEQFQNDRAKEQAREIEKGLQPLRDEISTRRRKVEELKKVMIEIRDSMWQ